MDKKTYLCRYHNILEKIEKKKQYIEFCEERANSIPAPVYGERINNPSPSYEAPFVRWIYKGIESEEELEELEKKAGLIRIEIEKAINTVKEEDLQMILTYRYIDWLTWSEIAAKVYYSDKTIRRKHDQAIELIKIDQV